MSAQLWWGVGAVVLSAAIAGVAAWPIYASTRVVLVVGVGTLLGGGSVLLGRLLRRRWFPRLRWGWTAGIAAVGYLLAVVPVAIPSAAGDTGRVVRGVIDGVVGVVVGWKQLLTVDLPASDYQAVLVPLLVVITAGTLAATALIVQGGRWAPLAAVPMLAMPLFGAAFGSRETGADALLGTLRIPAPAHVVLGVAAVAVCLVWLMGRARITRMSALRAVREQATTVRQGRESLTGILRRQLLAAGLVIVALVAGIAAAPLATGLGGREVLREGVDPLLLLARQPSPLAAYRGWFAGEAYDTELFRVSGAAGLDRLRIATLDDYDGETFRVSTGADGASAARFTRVPRTASHDAGATVTIGAGYSGIWVPLGEAGEVAPVFMGPNAELLADGFYADDALDAAVVVTDASGGGLQEGDSYRIPVSEPSAEAGFASTVGGDAKLEQDAYPALAAWVELQDVGRSGADLIDLVERLRARGYLSHALRTGEQASQWIAALQARADYEFAASRAGHSTGRIEELFASLVEQQRRAGDDASEQLLIAGIGDDEQFATAAALLARHLGFDSRVVVGVRLGDAGSDTGVEPCREVCTGANVTAWAEARGASGGWVALDATPQFAETPSTVSPSEQPPQNPTVPREPAAEVLDPPAAESDDRSTSPPAETTQTNWLDAVLPIVVTVAVSLLALVLLALPLLVFPVAKAARRRWRRTASSEVAMVGAWQELLDHYIDYRQPVPRGLTRTETADAVRHPSALVLAELVDRAVFAEHAPSDADGDASWRLVDEERRRLAREAGFWRRVRAFLTPASLLDRPPVSPAASASADGRRRVPRSLPRQRQKDDR
ncbi:MAG: transglutaminase domain-containing protein [Protaetiibacter sp.]